MVPGKSAAVVVAIALFAGCGFVQASDETIRSYDRVFFDSFSPQSALEMINRLPGFSLEEADEDRGLSQGGTNVLLNGRPITGKGDTATTQIAQIAPESVLRIDILDAGTLDIPGFSGLVANIVTQRTSINGSFLWEPEFKESEEAALGNGNLSVSGSFGALDVSLALNATSVRVTFDGPETLTAADDRIFETRDETLTIRGDQPALSASLGWNRPNGHVLNAKTSFTWLDLDRQQISQTAAVLPRGTDSLNVGRFGQNQSDFRFDTDYSFPAFGGTLKLISVAELVQDDTRTRVTVDDPFGIRLIDQGFDEESMSQEGILRVEQSWTGAQSRSWQLAGEAAFNRLDLETSLLSFNTSDPALLTSRTSSETVIEEVRGEITLAHSRRITQTSDLQISLGSEYSTIRQGVVERNFFRPKGFVSYTMRPAEDWTLSVRMARDVGQINFRNFAASVSLFENVTTGNNPELVPQQSWVFTGRAERRFGAGHVVSLEIEHELISDLVDRIPLGESGDAIGNLPEASQTSIDSAVTVLGKPFGFDGVQLDLRGIWRWSSVEDPIQGFRRDIGGLRTRELSAEFRHDIPESDWSYGFTFQDLELAPLYQSTLFLDRNIPGGGLTPGANAVFIEHKDLFGFRARFEVSEFIDHESRLKRIIHEGRRDIAPVDRIEERERSLGGPYVSISIGRTF